MYNPQKLKFKKLHNKKIKKKALYISKIFLKKKFYNIQILESGYISDYQIESVRRLIAKKTKRQCKIYIRNLNLFPLTKKALGLRMGKGKGPIKFWIRKIRAGTILLDILLLPTNDLFILKNYHKFTNNKYFNIYSILRKAIKKIPLKTKILTC